MGADWPSGSGKSTLFHAVSGLLTPTSGEIVVDGKDVAKMTEKEKCDFRAKEIGCIFQKPCSCPISPSSRISVSPHRLRERHSPGKDGESPACLCRLSEYAPRKADALSGGEAQRVAFLRAILRKPAVLLADEPTASLDRANSELIVESSCSTNTRAAACSSAPRMTRRCRHGLQTDWCWGNSGWGLETRD